ncbi:MAG TPA: hypothetical protein VMT18_10095, partial [Planctomycetota bacterium]|nr:hypothetical protein [Planctomycetota bacterium]
MDDAPEVHDACRVARAAFAHYPAGSAATAAALREHLRGCGGCREAFAGSIGCGAEDAGGVRSTRLRRERRERRTRQRSLALAGAFQGWTGGARGARLRLLLVPAFAIVLMTQVARGPRLTSEVRAQALAGAVWLDADDLATGSEPRTVRLGEGCSTGSDGRARLGSRAASVELAPDARAWLEAHAPARFRLGEGRFTLHGDLTATSRWGVLECEGAVAVVRVAPDRLVLEVSAGTVRCFDHRGERRLTP